MGVARRTRRWQHLPMRIALALAVLVGFVATVDAKPKKQPNAFVIVLDRSGSMQGAKLEAAKKAVLASVKTLGGQDTFALVTFDSEAQLAVAPKKASQKKVIETEVKAVRAGGGTNIYPGLKEARAAFADLKGVKKHVILLSDGEAPIDGIVDLVTEMHATDGITVSTVGVQGADRNLLQLITDAGAGRLYMVDDFKKLSAVFVEETKLAMK